MSTNLQNLIRAEERMRLASEEQRAAFIGRQTADTCQKIERKINHC
jgi:hypothetical protein